ncbi:MAG: hypothetical protein ACFFB6_02845 [Promethearchaeota archaeon]
MKSISEPNSSESYRIPLLKKGYIKIFTSGIILLVAGFTTLSLFNMIPRPAYGDPAYYDFYNLMRFFSSLSRLFLQIGMVLIILSLFIGALTDRTLSENVKRGMMIASGAAMFGLIILMIYSLVMYY